jgi:hypothetical protein
VVLFFADVNFPGLGNTIQTSKLLSFQPLEKPCRPARCGSFLCGCNFSRAWKNHSSQQPVVFSSRWKSHAGQQDVVLFFADVIFPGPGKTIQTSKLGSFPAAGKAMQASKMWFFSLRM